jgi:GTP-binding protein
LKLVADIWIIWVPSAWKSTFIWNVTNVKPKIGDYPFTTLTPNLWVLDHKWKSLVLEDVPWLIPWASEWKWLGIEFLKHIERTWVLLHLLDLSRLDKIFKDYEDIRFELKEFSDKLEKKEEIIVLSKADLLDEEMKKFILQEFKSKYPNKKVFIISSATREWIEDLVDYLIDNYSKDLVKEEQEDKQEIIIYDLKQNKDPKHVEVEYLWDMKFKASWERLEQIVRMTNFDNKEAVMRVYDVLEKMWVIKKVEKELEKIVETENIDNEFFFEGNENQKDFSPKIEIASKEISLDKLRYNL